MLIILGVVLVVVGVVLYDAGGWRIRAEQNYGQILIERPNHHGRIRQYDVGVLGFQLPLHRGVVQKQSG